MVKFCTFFAKKAPKPFFYHYTFFLLFSLPPFFRYPKPFRFLLFQPLSTLHSPPFFSPQKTLQERFLMGGLLFPQLSLQCANTILTKRKTLKCTIWRNNVAGNATHSSGGWHAIAAVFWYRDCIDGKRAASDRKNHPSRVLLWVLGMKEALMESRRLEVGRKRGTRNGRNLKELKRRRWNTEKKGSRERERENEKRRKIF